MLLLKRSQREIIVYSIVVIILILLAFMANNMASILHTRQSAADDLQRAEMSLLIVRISELRAMERGLTMSVLGLNRESEVELRHKIDHFRIAGDKLWNQLMIALQDWFATRSSDTLLATTLDVGIDNQKALERNREQVDVQLDGKTQTVQPLAWFKDITNNITHLHHINEVLRSNIYDQNVANDNFKIISEWASRAGEYAGQNRGLLAYYIGAGLPTPDTVKGVLQDTHEKVSQYVLVISSLRLNNPLGNDLDNPALTINKIFTPEFKLLREKIIEGSVTGIYPISQKEWLLQVNQVVSGLKSIAITAATMSKLESKRKLQSANQRIIWLIIMGVIALLTSILAFILVVRTSSSLESAKQKAELIVGKLSQEIHKSRILERSLRIYQQIVSTTSDQIAILNNNYTISLLNKPCHASAGVTTEPFIGKHAATLFGEDAFEGWIKPSIDKCLIGGTTSAEYTVNNSRGYSQTFNTSFMPIETESGDQDQVLFISRDVTDERKHKQALLEREAQLHTITDSMPGMVVQLDAKCRYAFVNKTYEEWMGITFEQVKGRALKEILGQDVYDPIEPFFKKALAGFSVMYERDLQRNDGETHRIEVHLIPEFDNKNKVKSICTLANDITKRKQIEKALSESKAGFKNIVEANNTGILVINDNKQCLFSNSAARNMFSKIQQNNGNQCELSRINFNNNSEIMISTKESDSGIALMQTSRTIWEGKEALLVMLHDITARKITEKKLEKMAYHDALTGLPNRTLARDRLLHSLERASRRNTLIGLLFIDLDRFKSINDSLGHAAGDELLKVTADRLCCRVRSEDTVARLSGDEFLVILEDIEDASHVEHIASDISKSLCNSCVIQGTEIYIDASIGISIYPNDSKDCETLMRHADTAMYHAKNNGQYKIMAFKPTMDHAHINRLALEAELRTAINNSEFTLNYQPIVNISTGMVEGAEALLRWNNPRRGMVMPNDFIPVLEETGLIVPVGNWILREAFKQIKLWSLCGIFHLTMSINISGMQFKQASLLTYIDELLDETGANPESLQLEITETVLMEANETAIHTLSHMKNKGIKLAIDDFGTGYSSLNYIKRFAVDRIKIDRSFIRDFTEDKQDLEIVRAILAIAKALDLKVTAEGVETDQQFTLLHELGCHSSQGFLHKPAVETAIFEEYCSLINGDSRISSISQKACNKPTVFVS